jgi:VWFA-related protein
MTLDMRRPFTTVFVLAVSALALAQTPPPQTAPPPTQQPAQEQQPPVFRRDVNVVQLDVSVLDKNRRPIRDLTSADFEVLEDGKPQTVVAVSEVAFPDEAVPPPVWTRAAPPDITTNDADGKRVFMIVIAAGRMIRQIGLGAPGVAPAPDHEAIEAVRRAANGVLHRLGPDDLVGIAISGRGITQPFTNDLDKLHGAVDEITGIPPRLIMTGEQLRRTASQREATGEIGGVHLLRNITEYMMAMPDRRKAIIFISSGFGISSGGWPEYLAEVLQNASLGNITIYGINPYELGPRAADSRALDGIIALSDNTGGTSINHPRDLDTGLEQVFLENGSYYMVGYRTSNVAMDGKFRRVSVKVRGRPDLIVRSRTQIFRPRPQHANGVGPAPQFSSEMRPGLQGLLPSLDVTLSVAAMPFAQAGRREVAVPLAVSLAEPVAPGATRIVQRMTLRILAYTERGDLVRDVKFPVPLDVVPGPEPRVRYEALSRLDLEPGPYSLRVVVQNHQTDKLGSVHLDLSVPDYRRDGVSLSAVAIAAAADGPVVGADSLGALLPIVPTARRAFKFGETVTAFARVYQGGAAPLEPVRLDARVVNATGVDVLNAGETLAPDRFDASRACDWKLNLPVDKLEAGHYLLTLQATLGSRHSPKRDVRFSIR